jgi:hypothetical protein
MGARSGRHAHALQRTAVPVTASRRRAERGSLADLVETVERLTSRKVSAFMSANHSEPDVAAEIFLMDRSVVGAGGQPAA